MATQLIEAPNSSGSTLIKTCGGECKEFPKLLREDQIISHAEKACIKSYRKVDVRLLALYCFVHLALAVNAHNIANAAIINREYGDGIQKQLGELTSEQWALILSILYYPFIVCEPLATLMLKKFGPRKWMSRIMLIWGAISTCQAATKNFGGLLACRVLLGFTEAGFFASMLFHLSFWYPADELPLRVAALAACGHFSGIISGVVAFGVSYMNRKAELAGWRWLFILEGIPAILCGVYSAFFLPNYPETASFLSEEEKRLVIVALPASQPSSQGSTWNVQEMKALMMDPTLYSFCAIWALYSIGAKGIGAVLPTVIYDLGMAGTTKAQLMTMPPAFFGTACLLVLAWLIKSRRIYPWPTALGLVLLSCSCYVTLIFVRTPIARYVVILLATTSSIGVFPLLWPERIRSISGTTSAGFAIGATNAAGHLQGIVGPQIFQESFGPSYFTSFVISTCLLGGSICAISITWCLLKRKERCASSDTMEETKQANSGRESKKTII